MLVTTKLKAVYSAVVLVAQAYLVYAATLYVDVASAGFACVLTAAGASAVGALFYVFVLANHDEVGGYNARFEPPRVGHEATGMTGR